MHLNTVYKSQLSRLVIVYSLFMASFTLADEKTRITETTCKDDNVTLVDRLSLKIKTGAYKSQNEARCEAEITAKMSNSLIDENYLMTKKQDQDFRNEQQRVKTEASINSYGSAALINSEIEPSGFETTDRKSQTTVNILPRYETKGNN